MGDIYGKTTFEVAIDNTRVLIKKGISTTGGIVIEVDVGNTMASTKKEKVIGIIIERDSLIKV